MLLLFAYKNEFMVSIDINVEQPSTRPSHRDSCCNKGDWLFNCYCGWYKGNQIKVFFVNNHGKHEAVWVWRVVWCSFSGKLLYVVSFNGRRALNYNVSNSFLFFILKGRSEDPAEQEIELTTAPSVDYNTHWGQQVCATLICWWLICPWHHFVIVVLLNIGS